MSLQDRVRVRYNNPAKEEGRFGSRAQRMESRHTKLLLEEYITPEAEVVEFGCATGHYAAHWNEKCKSYLGVELSPQQVDFFNAKGFANATAQVGNATNCPEIADGSFDVVLCLGPMYHLDNEGQLAAMQEMARVCRPGGVLAFAYINKVGVYMHVLTGNLGGKRPWHKRTRRNRYPNRAGNEAAFTGVNDEEGNPFFFTMPEEMEELAAACGLQLVQNAGVDIVLNAQQIDHMDDEQYACWLEFAEYMLQWPSCTGMANHALMICRK